MGTAEKASRLAGAVIPVAGLHRPHARSEFRLHACIGPMHGTASAWTIEPAIGVRTPIKLTGLKPGTTYAFQVRSLGKTGYSDWSDSVTLMCT
jgi:hypothetical protein